MRVKKGEEASGGQGSTRGSPLPTHPLSHHQSAPGCGSQLFSLGEGNITSFSGFCGIPQEFSPFSSTQQTVNRL